MRKRFIRSSAILASSLASLAPQVQIQAAEASKYVKKLRESALSPMDLGRPTTTGLTDPPPRPGADRYPWKESIVTTTFWIGEAPTKNNPVPNHVSSWDANWAQNFGGTDDPDKTKRADFIPVAFTPQQNPFYVALPYNDLTRNGHKPEAAQVIPWFKQAFTGNGKTVLKGRWLAIRFRGKVCYAQWEDCGPFRTDHWQYVFGNERPKPNLNRGAGLDVSPAVRDFLGMADTDVTDWKFVEFNEIPSGPWATFGNNNTFVINQRRDATEVVSAKKIISPLP
jgi:hypothetical protein